MIEVETTRPVYSNAEGDKKSRKVRAGSRKDSRTGVSEKQQSRDLKRANRKAKRNAKRLIRMEKQGKKKFFYPLTKIFGKKKKYKDGSTIEVPAENTVVVSTNDGRTASLDKTEIAKALNIPESQVTPAKVQEVVVNVPQASAGPAANETGTPSGEPVLAIPVKDEDVTIADDGSAYLSDDTQSQNEELKNVADDDKEAQKKKKIGKIILISGVVIIVLGAVVYFMNKGAKSKK